MSDDTGSPAADEPRDKFYRGRIKKLFLGTEMGIVRSGNGRELPFTFRHVTMVGNARRFDELREGMSVGFDVGWTSKGLVVTVLQTDD
jgi:hypothetical protein